MTESEQLVALSKAWMQAIATNRAEDIAPFMTDDWQLITLEAGPISKEHFLGAIASGGLVHDDMHSVDDPCVRLYGDSAVIIARVQNHGRYAEVPFQYDEWSTDTYVRTPDGWRCAVTALTPITRPGEP